MEKNTMKPITEKLPGSCRPGRSLLAALILIVLCCFGSPINAELQVVTGQNWTETDRDAKLAFLLGIATMVKAEQNLIGDPPPPGTVSFAPAIAKGVGDMSLTEIMTRIDAFFSENPESMDKAVIVVIWENIVIPKLEAAGK